MLPAELDFKLPLLPANLEVVATTKGIHDRIQGEMYHKLKVAEAMGEALLEAPPGWNEVPDLMMGPEGKKG